VQDTGEIQLEYQNYDRQKCFVAHSLGAEWREDLKSACTDLLPKFSLEPWYAADHFNPTQSPLNKVVELIANSRYGIYDISSWQDPQGHWQLPRNVFIELGIAIALNRPTLLLRHSSNKSLPLPACLQGVETIEFTGDITLKKELEKRLPQWLDVPPDRDWLDRRFCVFGNRTCSFREQHPCSQQWGEQTLHCHVDDGMDKQHPDYCQSECDEIRGAIEEVFSRYSDLEFSYLGERSPVEGYQFLLCSHCQSVRSTLFAIYRITPMTSAETFMAIGFSIALERLFAYKIPKVFLVRQIRDLPSLLQGYEAIEATGSREIKRRLKADMPRVITLVRSTSWRPRALPFTEARSPRSDEPVISEGNLSTPKSNTHEPIEIFFSYSREDKPLRDDLEIHLSSLKRQGVISSWHDRQIVPGSEWTEEIDRHMKTADIILLLISSDFVASKYCYEVELPNAIARHEAGEAFVMPILLRPVAGWENLPFAKLQVFPSGGRPITQWSNENEAFVDVVMGIRMMVESLLKQRAQRAYDYVLTPREAEIWQLRSEGLSYKAIASELFIAENTVKKHVKNILTKRREDGDVER
jgi:DNA-binding CsgD family transcriptional regulator